MTFQELQLMPSILTTLHQQGYHQPSPIQEQAIPIVLQGRDVLASAQTGSGKTAAFALPIIQQLATRKHSGQRHIHTLVLAPTRELAEQIKDSINTYRGNLYLRAAVIYGGVSQRSQEMALKRGVDIVIATPGRLMDLMNQRLVNLQYVQTLILDEADRMLDMGFSKDVRKIVASIPVKRQTLLFSATIPNEILSLAHELLTDPVRIEVTPPSEMVDTIQQSLYTVPKKQKTPLLLHLLKSTTLQTVLVFTRTKHGANKLVKELLHADISADAIHGNKSQSARIQALKGFKSGKIRVLVATDIAARGIDVDDLSHVINYDLPDTAETYVHRMGRTGRAGRLGEAYSFCSEDEAALLAQIEKHMAHKIPMVMDHPFHAPIKPVVLYKPKPLQPRKRSRSRRPTRSSSSANYGARVS